MTFNIVPPKNISETYVTITLIKGKTISVPKRNFVWIHYTAVQHPPNVFKLSPESTFLQQFIF